jgi:hypothetical protein
MYEELCAEEFDGKAFIEWFTRHDLPPDTHSKITE